MPKPAYQDWTRSVAVVVLIAHVVLVLLGIAWWITTEPNQVVAQS